MKPITNTTGIWLSWALFLSLVLGLLAEKAPNVTQTLVSVFGQAR